MKKAWSTVQLGDLLTLRRERIELIPGKTYKRITVKLGGLGVVLRDEVDGGAIKSEVQFSAHAGQFVASKIDARNGSFGLIPSHLDGSVVSGNFLTFDCNPERILPVFIDYFSKRPSFWEDCSRISEGTTNRVPVRVEQFLEMLIQLPPLAEQRQVVARIEELAAQIEEAKTLRKQAAEEAEALWTLSASKIFDRLAESHPVRSLGEIVTISGGGTPSKSVPFYWEGRIPWITPKDMKRRELSDAIDHISERATQETPAKLIQPGAVLVVVRGMILAHTFPSAVLRASAAINQDMKALVPKKELLPEFLCAFFWASNSRMLELVEKSTHDTRKFETEKLLGTNVVVPPILEQHQVMAELDALKAEVDKLKCLQAETAAEMDALLPSILDKAFKGEL